MKNPHFYTHPMDFPWDFPTDPLGPGQVCAGGLSRNSWSSTSDTSAEAVTMPLRRSALGGFAPWSTWGWLWLWLKTWGTEIWDDTQIQYACMRMHGWMDVNTKIKYDS